MGGKWERGSTGFFFYPVSGRNRGACCPKHWSVEERGIRFQKAEKKKAEKKRKGLQPHQYHPSPSHVKGVSREKPDDTDWALCRGARGRFSLVKGDKKRKTI